VVYARYSTDLQREDSIEDQVEVCRRVIDRNGWSFGTVYHDRAMSGSSRFRPSYQQLLADAEQGRFDIVVCEALDRLGRKLSDIADLFDRLSFNGIKVHTVTTGQITALHIGMLGTMSQLFIADLREKTWRGQLGRARKGRIPGGRAFGYEVVAASGNEAPEGGLRRINPGEASVVLRIFEEYAGGRSPRDIAKDLNAEGVPGPEGRLWGDTTIRGQVGRGTGILNNTLYIGRLEWNRVAYVKNPSTGKRIARVNESAAREVVAVSELRIVDDTLWDRAKQRQQEVRVEKCTWPPPGSLSARLPGWVNLRHDRPAAPCPESPSQRTQGSRARWSGECQH